MSDKENFKYLIFNELFGSAIYNFDDAIKITKLVTILELYKLKTLKFQQFTSTLQALSHSCDYGTYYEGFHDIHNITAEGKSITFIKPSTKEEYLTLYVCPLCLEKLTLNDFLERCYDFQNTFFTKGIIS